MCLCNVFLRMVLTLLSVWEFELSSILYFFTFYLSWLFAQKMYAAYSYLHVAIDLGRERFMEIACSPCLHKAVSRTSSSTFFSWWCYSSTQLSWQSRETSVLSSIIFHRFWKWLHGTIFCCDKVCVFAEFQEVSEKLDDSDVLPALEPTEDACLKMCSKVSLEICRSEVNHNVLHKSNRYEWWHAEV